MNRTFILILIALVSLTVIFFAGIYGISEWKLNNVNAPTKFEYSIKTDSTTIKYGQHLARTRGCIGCHGQQLEGQVFKERWGWVDVAVAPNLAKYARENDPSAIERAVRRGIAANGESLWSMPSYNWVNLSDEDIAAIIAYMQTSPVVEKELQEPNLGFKARWNIAVGNSQHMAEWASQIPPIEIDSSKTASYLRGQYIAMTTCNECHGINMQGEVLPDMSTPNLKVITTYPEVDFHILMKAGIAIGGKENIGLMHAVVKDRFVHFTDMELYDLYSFLNAKAEE